MDASSLQSLHDAEVFSPCSIEHQDVFMYDDERRGVSGNDSPTYLDISASKNDNLSVKSEPDCDTLTSWTQKHPEHWTQNEILDWIYFVAGTLDVDHSTIRGEAFQNITGPELCRMTLDDFMKRDPVNGRCFYDMFKEMHRDSHFIEPQGYDPSIPSQYNVSVKVEKQEPGEYPVQTDLGSNLLDNVIVDGTEMKVRVGEYWYPIDCEEDKYFCEEQRDHTFPINEGYGSSDSESTRDQYDVDMFGSPRFMSRSGSTGSEVMSDDDLPTVVPSHMDGQKPLKRKPTTQRKKSTSNPDKQQNRGRKPGQISKGNHLWEFIRDLLKDPRYNPQLLRWEEKETGVFRFVQSEAVARMWGDKKHNTGMTYEKLSRAMRFCRTAGYFAEVPKTGKFPKKLCFRFGEKAFGWEE